MVVIQCKIESLMTLVILGPKTGPAPTGAAALRWWGAM